MKPFPENSGADSPLLPDKPRRHLIHRWKARNTFAFAAVVLFGATITWLGFQLPSFQYADFATQRNVNAEGLWGDHKSTSPVIPPGISLKSFQQGLSKCQRLQTDEYVPTEHTRHRNPRSAVSGSTLIKNGYLWLGDHYLNGDILIQDGLIRNVSASINVDNVDNVIDAKGRVVTPGIVDMHSHMTVDSFPGLSGLEDDNEMTNPTTPYVRVIDAINPSDPGIKIVASGGITTSLILPGSGNMMGGEAAVIKLRPVPTLSVRDMLVTAGVTEEDHEVVWRYMKMACGENPKSYYGGVFNKMPMTRLGEGYLFRRRFQEAQILKQRQDDWCDAARRINETIPYNKPINEQKLIRLTEAFPESLKLESLVALLRHQVKLNVHCYLPQDLEAMVHHSLEFDFEIAAFHHALSAWQVPDVLKRAKTNITVATFADMWGYKAEAWDQNVNAPTILSEAGIPVAFKSDHPVTNARDLLHEAQKAYHYGFDEHKALAAITSVPANALALGHRIGSIAPGMDADLVIWERHPLRLGARPKHVFIDGLELDFSASWTKHVDDPVEVNHELRSNDNVDDQDLHWLPSRPESTMKLEDHGLGNPTVMENACASDINSFVLRNISRLYLGPGQTLKDDSLYLVVTDGIITCAGSHCDRDSIDWPESSPVFEMGGAIVTPGIVSAGVPLGLGEIMAEPSTQDGNAKNDLSDDNLPQHIARAVDGVKINGLHMEKAFKAGVTTAVSQLTVEDNVLAGVSVAFRMGAKNTLLDNNDTIIREEAALHFVISHSGKNTVSQQIAAIRNILLENADKDPVTNVFARATQQRLPVVVEANDKDEIASIIQIKQQLRPKYNVRFIILGGAESYLVADHLSRMEIPVILMPARCYPITWQSRHCLTGPPITPNTAIDILVSKGVQVGLASTDPDNGDARNLIWEAGWNLAYSQGLTEEAAVGLVTWNLGNMFGFDEHDSVGMLSEGHRADFVAYNGNPFEFGTKVLMVYGGSHPGPLCFPQQI